MFDLILSFATGAVVPCAFLVLQRQRTAHWRDAWKRVTALTSEIEEEPEDQIGWEVEERIFEGRLFTKGMVPGIQFVLTHPDKGEMTVYPDGLFVGGISPTEKNFDTKMKKYRAKVERVRTTLS